MKKPTVLLVEHDVMLADVYQRALQDNAWVLFAGDSQAAIDAMDSNHVDLVLMDVQLGVHNGIEIIHEIRSYEDWSHIPIVLLSSVPASDFQLPHKEWARYGIKEYLYKLNTPLERLVESVNGALTA